MQGLTTTRLSRSGSGTSRLDGTLRHDGTLGQRTKTLNRSSQLNAARRMITRIQRSGAGSFFGFPLGLTCSPLSFFLSVDTGFFGCTDSVKIALLAGSFLSSLGFRSQTLFFLGTTRCFSSGHDLDLFRFATLCLFSRSLTLRLEDALTRCKFRSRQGTTTSTSTATATRTASCRATRTRGCTLWLANLNLHDLGPAMAEALPHGAGIHCTTNILAACGA